MDQISEFEIYQVLLRLSNMYEFAYGNCCTLLFSK